jgi:hypothetical protein
LGRGYVSFSWGVFLRIGRLFSYIFCGLFEWWLLSYHVAFLLAVRRRWH